MRITKMFCIVFGIFLAVFSIRCTVVETDLELFLRKNVLGKKVTFVPNPGNAGDAFIWYGTICLFDKVGLKYNTSSLEKVIISSDVVLYSGGGNLVPYYSNCAEFIKYYMHKVKHLILLPHTIAGHEELLKQLTPNVTLFCREYMSYNYCKKLVPYPDNVFFSRDLAFYAKLDRYKQLSLVGKRHLFAFRTDREKNPARKKVKLPVTNKDISNIGSIDATTSFERNMETVDKFLSIIAQSEIVWTDRLHVGIAAFLLGKRVHLFDNSYKKIEAVYRATVSCNDSKKLVTFHGTDFNKLKYT